MKNQSKDTRIRYDNRHYLMLLAIAVLIILLFVTITNISHILTFLKYVGSVFTPIIIGFVIAFIINLPMRFFENVVFARLFKKQRRFNIKRYLCIFLSFVIIISLLVLLFSFVLPELVKNCLSFLERLPDYAEKLNNTINSFADRLNLPFDFSTATSWETIGNTVVNWLSRNGENITQNAFSAVSVLINGVLNFVIGIVLSIYILASKEHLGIIAKRLIYAVFNRKHARSLISVLSKSNEAFSKFLSGQCIEVLLIGVLCFIGMMIFRFPYALMVSCIIAITAFIPVFGAIIGAVVGALLILLADPVKALWFLLFIIILQQLESNIIYPRIIGNHVGLPGMWVLFAVTIGGGFFGPLGIIFSVPLCSVLRTLLQSALSRRLARRNMDYDTFTCDASDPLPRNKVPHAGTQTSDESAGGVTDEHISGGEAGGEDVSEQSEDAPSGGEEHYEASSDEHHDSESLWSSFKKLLWHKKH